MDITYIPMAKGFVYLAVVLDWFSRRVLSSCRRRSGRDAGVDHDGGVVLYRDVERGACQA